MPVTGHGLTHDELATTLERAFGELSGPPAAIRLLHRCGSWLTALDEAGLITIGPPHPDDPDARPRATVDWLGALAAAGYGGALANRSLHVVLDGERQPYGVEPDPDQPRRDLPVLRLAAALAGAAPVDLNSALCDLDRPTTAAVLAAVSSATQAHVRHHRATLPDGRPSTWGAMTWVGPLYDWSQADAEARAGRRDEDDGPWRQGRLSLYPAAEEEAATASAAHADPYPEARLPLDAHLLRVLGALRPPSRSRRGGGRRRSRSGHPADSLAAGNHVHTREEVEAWLGFPLPTLTPLEDDGLGLVCLTSRHFWTTDGDPLPARGSSLPNGEPMELSISLLWLPPGADLGLLEWADLDDRGLTSGLVQYSPFARAPEDEPARRATSLTEPAGGYTGISVGGTRLGVQNRGARDTRVGWSRQGPDARYGIALHLPLNPVAAVELVLRSRDVP